jgi:hypothetical protein
VSASSVAINFSLFYLNLLLDLHQTFFKSLIKFKRIKFNNIQMNCDNLKLIEFVFKENPLGRLAIGY